MVNYIWLAWKLACMLRLYRTCNPTVGFSKYEFNNKLLGDVTIFRITWVMNFTSLLGLLLLLLLLIISTRVLSVTMDWTTVVSKYGNLDSTLLFLLVEDQLFWNCKVKKSLGFVLNEIIGIGFRLFHQNDGIWNLF